MSITLREGDFSQSQLNLLLKLCEDKDIKTTEHYKGNGADKVIFFITVHESAQCKVLMQAVREQIDSLIGMHSMLAIQYDRYGENA